MTKRIKTEAEMTACEVQGDRRWPSHMTTDEMRKQLRHEENEASNDYVSDNGQFGVGA